MYIHMAYMYVHSVHTSCTWYIKYCMYILYMVYMVHGIHTYVLCTCVLYVLYCIIVRTQYVCMCELSSLLYNGGQCDLCCPVDTLALHIQHRKDLGASGNTCKLLLHQLHDYCIALYCTTANLQYTCLWILEYRMSTLVVWLMRTLTFCLY